MNGNDTYGPTPIKLETFANIESITGAITNVIQKTFDSGPRWVATLDDEWTLIVNPTSYRVISKVYGSDSDNWLGQRITAYKGTMHVRGEEKDGVCVRIPEPPPEKTPGDGVQDDIPF